MKHAVFAALLLAASAASAQTTNNTVDPTPTRHAHGASQAAKPADLAFVDPNDPTKPCDPSHRQDCKAVMVERKP